MPSKEHGSLPHYPNSPPPGVSRLDHLPTVEASIRYWEAIEARARRCNDFAMLRTAAGLKSSYEAARVQLQRAAKSGAPHRTAKA
jgi:hypothetical protein